MWNETTAFVTYLTINAFCIITTPIAIGSLICRFFGDNLAAVSVLMSLPIGLWIALKMSSWFLRSIKIKYD